MKTKLYEVVRGVVAAWREIIWASRDGATAQRRNDEETND